MITQQRLKQLLHYNPQTGTFKWRKSRSGVKAGSVAGCRQKEGYRKLTVDGKTYQTGEFPDVCLSHGNYKRSDNAWDNIVESARAYSPILYKKVHIASLATRIDKLVVLRDQAKLDLQNMQAGGI